MFLSVIALWLAYIALSLWVTLLDLDDLHLLARLPRIVLVLAGMGLCGFVVLSVERFGCNQATLPVLRPHAWISGMPMLISLPLALLALWLLGFESPSVSVLLTVFGIGNVAILARYVLLTLQATEDRHGLARMVTMDELTGIRNRRGLMARLEQIKRPEDYVVSADLNDFKSINDSYGHDVGDELLRAVARDLSEEQGVVDCGRLGGDEFVALIRLHGAQIEAVVETLHHALSKWRNLRGQRVFVGVSLGVVQVQAHSLQSLLMRADSSMYKAKHSGRGFMIYQPEVLPDQTRQAQREMIQSTIDSGKLYLHYQPIYCLRSGQVVGVEALLRMRDQAGNTLSPSEFLQVSRDVGQLRKLTMMLPDHIEHAADKLEGIQLQLNLPPDLVVDEQFLNDFVRAIKLVGRPLNQITLEITEEISVPLDELAIACAGLRAEGFRLAIDDFGSAHSSIARLAAVEVDEVKIDQALLRAASSGQEILLESALLMARRLGKSVTCEGIENSDQLKIVQLLGVDKAQGFLLAKPVSVSDFDAERSKLDFADFFK